MSEESLKRDLQRERDSRRVVDASLLQAVEQRDIVVRQRDYWQSAFRRLDAAVQRHQKATRDAARKGDEFDSALYSVRNTVLMKSPPDNPYRKEM